MVSPSVGTGSADNAARSKTDERLAIGLSLVTIGAVLSPIIENWRKVPRDDFPLSYFPMFSTKRADRARVTFLVGLDNEGGRTRLPYTLAGRGGLNQVRKQITRTVRRGEGDLLCRSIAARLARRRGGAFAAVTVVQIITGEFHLDDYFHGSREPLAERVRAECSVVRERSR